MCAYYISLTDKYNMGTKIRGKESFSNNTYLSKIDNVSIIVRDNREIITIARQCSNPYSVIVMLSCFYRIKRT